jgi:hypothetical protein
MTWTVLLTAPQREFKVRNELTFNFVPAYVPIEYRDSQLERANKTPVPLFPRYVFAVITDWGMLRNVDGLQSRPVYLVDGKPAMLSQREIDAVEALSQPIVKNERTTRRIGIGARIPIRRNHHAVIEALVARLDARGRPVAVFEMLGKTHEVVVTEEMID